MASSIRAFVLPRPRLERWPASLRRASSLVAAAFLVLLILVALFAPVLAPHDYARQDLGLRLQASSARFPLGTDEFGRDILSRLIFGARVSLSVAVCVELVELLFGLSLGMVSGLKGWPLDNLVMRVTDLMFAFPDILLAIL